jgi:hypothetical protein
MSATHPVEIVNLKDTLKATWMAGNYDYFSRFWNRALWSFSTGCRYDPAIGYSMSPAVRGSWDCWRPEGGWR